MLSYIARRLLIMIPTLFGVTVVSFCIMQLAPGDPLLSQLQGGNAGQSTQTRDAYRIQKRELHFDKPLLLNFRNFGDYTNSIRAAAYFSGRTVEEIRSELPVLAAHPDEPANAALLAFLESLGIPDFKKQLTDPERLMPLAKLVDYYVLIYCEDLGENGVSAAIAVLGDPKSDLKLKIGAIRALRSMVVEPFVYTYSVHPSAAETPAVVSAWKLWWNRRQKTFPPLDAEAKKFLETKMAEMAAASDKPDVLFGRIDEILNSDDADNAPRFFAETLFGNSTLVQKAIASLYLKQSFAEPLKLDVARDGSAAAVDEAATNWLEFYNLHHDQYDLSTPEKLWRVVSDTQYAYMVTRLVTFNFGNSTLKTHDLVSARIWSAFVVSAPLMFFSELLVYLIAVPLGFVCGVDRGGWLDRSISLVLFVLYSIPPFVAGMLFLVFLCYGDYLKWFPALGLHSDNAQKMSFLAYTLDYAHHAFLPIVCLSLFSMAAIAMYSRSALLDVINQDYIRTARAKGLSPSKVILKHAMRNSLIPILTLFSSFLPTMLGGAVLIESLFGIPGLGGLGWSSILQKDYPTLMALLYVEAIVTLLSFLATDILYVLVDPRISFGGRGKAA